MRSISSGSDILARVIQLTSTAADDPPAPASDPPPAPPRRMRVFPARPNPFSGTLRVPIEVPVTAGARIRAVILDASGRLVRKLFDGTPPEGRISLLWNGTDAGGREVASGVYW